MTEFDWARQAIHVREILELMAKSPWLLREPGSSGGDILHDPFGKTIHASDAALKVGSIHHLGVAMMDWHSEPVPILARILRQCSYEEVARLAQNKLATHAHYYEVLID